MINAEEEQPPSVSAPPPAASTPAASSAAVSQPMVDADFNPCHDSERQFAWGPEPDVKELAELVWHDSIDDSQ
jgi:hypothetical protein